MASLHEASGCRDYQQLNAAALAGSKGAHGGRDEEEVHFLLDYIDYMYERLILF